MLSLLTYRVAPGLLSGLMLQCSHGSMHITQESEVCHSVGTNISVMEQVCWEFLEHSEPDTTLLNCEDSWTGQMYNRMQTCFGFRLMWFFIVLQDMFD
jgi:hypothetical protein